MYICKGVVLRGDTDIILKYVALCFSFERLKLYDMKKTLSLVIALMLASICFAQKDVTKFLGIPVDGTKSDMIQKLKAKGFTYNQRKDCLEGEFNGSDVEIHVITNNNKVYRIMVMDALGINEASIKIRFNTLCHQFEHNERYVPANIVGKYEIGEDEDISYEMSVNSKRYEAAYYQFIKSELDTTVLQDYLLSKLSFEEFDNLSEEEKQNMIIRLSMEYVADIMTKKSVWFMIEQEYGRYYIIMFYDNEYNKANGEDL